MVRHCPRLETARLRLRPFVAPDAPALQQLAGERRIADTMISIPHPLSLASARSAIVAQARAFQQGTAVRFAIERREAQGLIGSVELRDVEREHSMAELSFWIATPWWGHGYAAEAAHETIRYGFRILELNRIYGHHMIRNTAGGSVLRQLGMKREGVLRQRVRKWGVFEDVALYSILRGDAAATREPDGEPGADRR